MPSVASAGLTWLRGLLGRREPEREETGVPAALDGATAVALVEACLSGEPVADPGVHGDRRALAAAMGATMGGVRTAAFLSGAELPAAVDLLTQAAGQHLPLVAQVTSRGLPGHGQPTGTSHDGIHAVSDAGWIQLVASDVQEAVDLTLVARRVAERALVPAMVVSDDEQTARAVHSVRVPDQGQVDAWAGEPEDLVDCPTPAQRLIFGKQRRRVPRWFDLERPTLTGARYEGETWAVGAAGQGPFFHADVPGALDAAMRELAHDTGRPLAPVRVRHTGDAEAVLVVMGAAAGPAVAVADALRSQGAKVGVLVVHQLAPFPGAQVVEHLEGRATVAVLDRTSTGLAGDPPLLRLVRAAMDQAGENARFGPSTHPGHPAVPEHRRPRLHGIRYGLGGQAVRAADLAALVAALREGGPVPAFLGVANTRATSPWPKRQALADALLRDHPHLTSLGLRAEGATAALPAGAALVAVHRPASEGGDHLRQLATLLLRASGTPVRGRLAPDARPDLPRLDQLVVGAAVDPGDDAPIDLLAVLPGAGPVPARVVARLAPAAAVVLVDEAGPQPDLGPRALSAVPDDGEGALAALLSLLRAREVVSAKDRQLTTARREVLSALPEAEVEHRLTAFEAGLSPAAAATPDLPARPRDMDFVPLAVRHLAREEEVVANLPRFWGQVGAPLRDGETLTPDPYLSTGVVPALSSTFRDLAPTREHLPAFDPALCTGCGLCWAACPDTALAPLVQSGTGLVEAGLALAEADGVQVGALRQVASKLGPRVNKVLGKAEAPEIGAAMDEAWAWLYERLPLPDDRKAEAATAFAAVREHMAPITVACTGPFFHEPDRGAPGKGEILSVVVNPDACKGCGLCHAVCEPGAIQMGSQDEVVLAHARATWALWEQLPDASGDTIHRAWEHPDVSTMAALQLARPCLVALAGGDSAEAGSGERIAARAVLAAVEFHLQPEVQAHLKGLEALRVRLDDAVRNLLADSLPVDDLDALSKGLGRIDRPGTELRELLGQVASDVGSTRVDTVRLGRLVHSARRLIELQWRLGQGPDGLGRARMGVVVTGEHATGWAATFPHNPFLAPVTAAPSEALHVATGLAMAALRQAVADARVARTAEAELDRPSTAVSEAEALASLSWHDLSPDERKAVPPVLVIGDEAALAEAPLGEVLRSGLPVVVVMLSPADLGAQRVSELELLALAHPHAAYLQASPAEPDHLVEGLLAALAHPGPALVRVHAPSPGRHGFPASATLSQARMAVDSRSFPVLRYVPTGASLGMDLDLDGNPDSAAAWSQGLTPAHWAATQGRHALEADPTATGPTPIHAYLQMDATARLGRTATVAVDDEARVVPPGIVAAVDERALTWRTLQELTGIETPFTQRVWDGVRAEVEAEHNDHVEALRQDHAAELASTRALVEGELSERVHARLIALAGYGEAEQ